MNRSVINSAVSMHGLQQKLDVIANNIANVNTVGYKRREATFQDVLTTLTQQPSGFVQEGRRSPLGMTEGWGAKISQVQLNMGQGPIQDTQNPLDMAVEGDALFEIELNQLDENGNTVMKTAWTRNGSFRLGLQPGDDENTYLTTDQGHLVRGTDNEPIRIPNGYSLIVDADGNIKAYNPTDPNKEAIEAGRLKLVQAVRPQMLESLGEHLFILPDYVDNTNGQVVKTLDLKVDDNSTVSVRQGYLEQSNVVLSDEMSELITVQRAYQLTSRALSSGDTMTNLANNLRG